jgi:hypothetical protein
VIIPRLATIRVTTSVINVVDANLSDKKNVNHAVDVKINVKRKLKKKKNLYVKKAAVKSINKNRVVKISFLSRNLLIQMQNLVVVFLLLFDELVPLIDRRLQNLQV